MAQNKVVTFTCDNCEMTENSRDEILPTGWRKITLLTEGNVKKIPMDFDICHRCNPFYHKSIADEVVYKKSLLRFVLNKLGVKNDPA